MRGIGFNVFTPIKIIIKSLQQGNIAGLIQEARKLLKKTSYHHNLEFFKIKKTITFLVQKPLT
jgi:hypothetical protein